MPHDLTVSQRKKHVDAAKELLDPHKQEPFLHRLVVCDEKWIPLNSSQRSNQWLRAKQKTLSTPKPDPHQKKVMLPVSRCWKGIIISNSSRAVPAMDADVYSFQLALMQTELRQNRSRQLFRRGVVPQQDDARPRVAN